MSIFFVFFATTGWSALLSRKNLLRASRHLADICGQCSLVFPSQAPTLVSACLVSLEPDSHFRMMPDQVTPDERFGQQSANSHLSTPEDASCTHILVFPTSATTRVSRRLCPPGGRCSFFYSNLFFPFFFRSLLRRRSTRKTSTDPIWETTISSLPSTTTWATDSRG
jgi:hypothetical protein